MRSLILALALLATAFAAIDSCDQCKSVVKKFSVASQQPDKIENLKMMLGSMCRETVYAGECLLFVSQLDKIVDRIQPQLKDEHVFCTRLQICSNNNIDGFRRTLLGMVTRAEKVYGEPALVCDECKSVVEELKSVIVDEKTQSDAREFIRENVCKNLGQYGGFCGLVVDEYLPQFIQEIDVILADKHQTCVNMNACNAGNGIEARKYVEITDEENKNVENDVDAFWNGLTMQNNKGQVLAMSCFECKLVVDSMQEDMIGNRKKLSDDVRDFACFKIVTANMTASCIDFLDLYLPTVIQMTIEQVTPEGVCESNKCCPKSSVSALRDFSYQEIESNKCSTMNQLESYVASNLVGSPIEKFIGNSMTESICSHSVSFFKPTCQQLMSAVAPRFVSLTAVLASQNKFSHALNC